MGKIWRVAQGVICDDRTLQELLYHAELIREQLIANLSDHIRFEIDKQAHDDAGLTIHDVPE